MNDPVTIHGRIIDQAGSPWFEFDIPEGAQRVQLVLKGQYVGLLEITPVGIIWTTPPFPAESLSVEIAVESGQ